MEPDTNLLELYLDESGSRLPDHEPIVADSGMNCFALGGIIFAAAQIEALLRPYRAFCKKWGIEYPLHSNEIRMRTGNFRWLAKLAPSMANEFFQDIENMVCAQPIVTIACIIHRPGYNARYERIYHDQRWALCKTAYAVVVERAAKFAIHKGLRLRVHFESSGKKENRQTIIYHRELKKNGMPFSGETSAKYTPLSAEHFRRVLLGDPEQHKKNSVFCQMADLVLYPMAKGAYFSDYRPYRHLAEQGKLIDCVIDSEQRATMGIKRSCFD